MNDIQEKELRKLIVLRIAEAHPDTLTMVNCKIDKNIINEIDYFEAKKEAAMRLLGRGRCQVLGIWVLLEIGFLDGK